MRKLAIFNRSLLGFLSVLSVVPVVKSAEDPSPLAVIRPAPEVELVEAGGGEEFRLSGLRGKAVLVGFVYTSCNGTCPATTRNMQSTQQLLQDAGLWGDRVEFVSITLDPETDDAGTLVNYARIFRADDPSWHFLTGPPDRVREVIAAWDMWARIGPSGTLDHPSRIFLLDPEGRQREIYNLDLLDPEVVLRDIRGLLREAGSTSEDAEAEN